MRVLGFDAPGGRAGAWAVVEDRRGGVLSAVGDLTMTDRTSEQDHLRAISDALMKAIYAGPASRCVSLICVEAPFLFRIAQLVGAAKMVAAQADVRCVMLNSNQARKLVLGRGGPGKAAKAEVLAAMVARFGARRIRNQHRADAALYALAGFRYVEMNRKEGP